MRSGDGRPGTAGRRIPSRIFDRAILSLTLFIVIAALGISSALVVYTAWLHDIRNGFFALIFAVLSAQIALNWFLWRDESEAVENTPE